MSRFDLDVGLHSIVSLSGLDGVPVAANRQPAAQPHATGADGNCFPRRILVFGDEELHLEMKTRSGKFKRWKKVTSFKLVPNCASKELRNGTLPL